MNSKKHSESETAGAVAGIIAEIASKGTPGVGPAVALTISAVLKSVQIARIKRMSETIEIAMDLMDVGLEIFEERAAEYDSRLELLAQVLETATHTTMPEKIRALSKILAHGFLDDQDGIARARILAAALGDIEGPHIRVLALLKSEPHPRPRHDS
ncbi:hypothetical protein F1D05_19460 [Kribbella qitaiheensis]|uniref:Uncharacterized protein n=1 Tax=Kribbella qitaiheensis TaxID=1544730 RepID=A0A7G6X0D6_9ACTN|nr:hypothetical protein [Kribbella qitaiheensis]QNE19701.1 hypothetical protein F1D05_19460 [Kribbella qitaiheensis]